MNSECGVLCNVVTKQKFFYVQCYNMILSETTVISRSKEAELRNGLMERRTGSPLAAVVIGSLSRSVLTILIAMVRR